MKKHATTPFRPEDQYHLFFEQSLDVMGIADYDTRILAVNAALDTTLGYHRDEIIGISYLELVHPDDLSFTLEAVAQLQAGQNLVAFENRFRHKDGSYRLIAWSISSHPEYSCIHAMGRDITDQRRLEGEIVEISAREQERIAHDLHDGLGQILTGLAYKAKLIESMIQDHTLPSPAQAREIVVLANQASLQARSLARGLDPVELQQGLPMALEYLAQNTQEVFGIACTLETDPEPVALDKPVTMHLYRIAQEAVNNAIRHGNPEQITIRLATQGHRFLLEVTNDGPCVKKIPDTCDGHGLRIMHYRAKLIGATFTFSPIKAGGLSISCLVHRNAKTAH